MQIDKSKFELPTLKNLQIRLDPRIKNAIGAERRKVCMSENDFVNATLYRAMVDSQAIPPFAQPENDKC